MPSWSGARFRSDELAKDLPRPSAFPVFGSLPALLPPSVHCLAPLHCHVRPCIDINFLPAGRSSVYELGLHVLAESSQDFRASIAIIVGVGLGLIAFVFLSLAVLRWVLFPRRIMR
jgi:hypothetical protein